jgi:hypothetical protein
MRLVSTSMRDGYNTESSYRVFLDYDDAMFNFCSVPHSVIPLTLVICPAATTTPQQLQSQSLSPRLKHRYKLLEPAAMRLYKFSQSGDNKYQQGPDPPRVSAVSH